ncbi:hypothetical protein [uncultured Stenotrophomonas sp.]|uniref:hypothetical protein n=1 Tax=uncultured Stenotrophomonas sp. TaxID=165438 RepID=UPI0028D0D230|nr:hypothetical protein [uncultured Stenotrophomonas sp.]
MTDIHARPLFDAPSRRQKELDQRQLEADLAKFRKAGGKVQVLGDTPLKKAKTRRQVIEGRLPASAGKEQAA